MQAKRYVFAAAAVLFAVGVVAQVFLAGIAVFGAGPWDDHIEFGYLVAIFPVLLIGLSLLARAGRTTVWLSILTLVVAQVQTILPWFRNDVPWVAALHPVNAMVVFGLGAIVTRRAISVARSPGRPHAAAVPAAPRV